MKPVKTTTLSTPLKTHCLARRGRAAFSSRFIGGVIAGALALGLGAGTALAPLITNPKPAARSH